jgi:hypothetical protein
VIVLALSPALTLRIQPPLEFEARIATLVELMERS